MKILNEILNWSNSRPAWQRDALRRLFSQKEITESDINELLSICLSQKGLISAESQTILPKPLLSEHLPLESTPSNKVRLIRLREIHNVNALSKNQLITFEKDGLTIIFGYNGSGKSGYARILRLMCHARHHDNHILPNIFSGQGKLEPSATIDYNICGEEKSHKWSLLNPSPSELRKINFFDTDCASVYVNESNEIAFTPVGLDLLPRLVNLCQKVAVKINTLIQELETDKPPSLIKPQAEENTSVFKLVESLNKDSDIGIFRRKADLSKIENDRIGELNEALSLDPKARADEIKSKLARLQKLHQSIDNVACSLSKDSIARIQEKLENYIDKYNAASIAAQTAFGDQPLSGIGESIWNELWEAARKFSQEEAYIGKHFPVTEDGAVCLLCQQSLSTEAKQRLNRFEEFIKADTQKSADRAKAELETSIVNLNNLIVGLDAYKDYISDLANDDVTEKSVRKYFKMGWKIKNTILKSLDDMSLRKPCDLPTCPTTLIKEITDRLKKRIEELDKMSISEERQKLTTERNELLARKWLATILEDVSSEIERQRKIEKLQLALRDTVTTGITIKNSELADKYVTNRLKDQFKNELELLGAKYLGIDFDDSGGKLGQKRLRITIAGAPQTAELRKILSEGEFRCIALAAFLAELSTEESMSALIFDDPVSSLDHIWRRLVASRLIDISLERQVIIFTHDITFLSDLVKFSEEKSTNIKQCYVYRGAANPGVCIDEVPWVAMKLNKRIGLLKKKLQEARCVYQSQGMESYDSEAHKIYGLLRESWERAIEEVLFNGAIERFSAEIHTKLLRKVADITDDDIRIIGNAMSKCSRFLDGHDQPGAVMELTPRPDELEKDILEIEKWAAEIKKRRSN